MQYHNAQLLYDFIKNNPVKRVLDLGTGIGASAAVMALAFEDKKEKDYKIDTIEQYDKCIALAKEIIPQELQTKITFVKAEPTTWKTEEIPYHYFSVYKELPPMEYDLIINDGPAPFEEQGKHLEEPRRLVDLPNGTIHKLTMEGKLKPGVQIVYDGRVTSLKILERYFTENFTLNFVPQGGVDFFLLERKDNPVKLVDEQHEAMKKNSPYFKNQKNENPIPINQQSAPSTAATASPPT